MSNPDRFQRLMEKFLRDKQHFDYLKKRGLTSLEIADRLIHNMFVMMRAGLECKYPDSTPQEINEKMRKISERELSIRNKRVRPRNGRN